MEYLLICQLKNMQNGRSITPLDKLHPPTEKQSTLSRVPKAKYACASAPL